MSLKKHYLFVVLLLFVSLSGFSAEPIERSDLERAFAKKTDMLDGLVQLLKPVATELNKKFQEFGDCGQNAHNMDWMQWRESNKFCGSTKSKADDFRRFVVREIEEVVSKIMLDAQMIPPVTEQDKKLKIASESLRWIAIGTPGPKSDIDTVGVFDDDIFARTEEEIHLSKIVAEIRAKTLFDALGIAVFGKPLSVVFDTESYIDVTDDLYKSAYEKRIQNPSYQNLAVTLAFVQVARQLHHPIQMGGKSIFELSLFDKEFSGSAFGLLLKDAKQVSDATFPKSEPSSNIKAYLPIINQLSVHASLQNDEIERSKIKGILGTYFPEAYYTREALAHVCYSDDDFSQLMLTLIAEYFKNGLVDEVPIEKINEFKQKTITPNAFIFAVSALENLGYFFHKLDRQDQAYDGLKNAAKYFFRLSRALAGYWNLSHLDTEIVSTDSTEQRYVRKLFFISERLERLKRGYVPFASPAEAGKIIREVDTFLKRNTKEEEIAAWANSLYALHANRYLSSNRKRESVSQIAKNFEQAIKYKNGLFSLEPMAAKNMASAELMSLFELVSQTDGNPEKIKLVRDKIENQLHAAQLPFFFDESMAAKLETLNPMQFTAFLKDLVGFVKYTLEDFAKVSGFKPKSLELAKQTQKLISLSGK